MVRRAGRGERAAPRDRARHPAPTGDEHGRGGRCGEGGDGAHHEGAARRREDRRDLRPLADDPPERARRGADAAAHARPRGARRVRVPALAARDGDPVTRAPALGRGDVRGDEGARLLARQPVADGAHARRWPARRRRDRGARERHASPRDGEAGDAGGARRRAGSRVHGAVDDALAHGGVPAAALHGRDHRATVPRVRRDARGEHPHLRRRVAHALADALVALPRCAHGTRSRRRAALAALAARPVRARVRVVAARLRAHAARGDAPPPVRVRRGEHRARAHVRAVQERPDRLHAERRHGLPERHGGGGAGNELRRHGAAPGRGRRASTEGPERRGVHEHRRRPVVGEPGATEHSPEGRE